MRNLFKLSVGTLAISAAVPALAAQGFESGTTAGFTSFCTTGATNSYGAFGPVEGNFLGFVEAGCGEGVYSTLTRVFNLTAGSTLTGSVGFQANDYLPYNDDAYLSINGNNLFTSSVAAVGAFGNSGWQTFAFTAPTTGSYTLQLGVTNRTDNNFGSAAVLDALSVPEPAAWTLMIGGFGLAGMAMRRKRAVRVTYA